MPPKPSKTKPKPKISLTGLGRARYSNCLAIALLPKLEQVAEYYEQPDIRIWKQSVASEGWLNETEYRDLCRVIKRHKLKLIEVIGIQISDTEERNGEERFSDFLAEEAELIDEKQRLIQEASSEQEGNAAIIYHKKLPVM